MMSPALWGSTSAPEHNENAAESCAEIRMCDQDDRWTVTKLTQYEDPTGAYFANVVP